ncbi:MAG TPA: hypothetical protein VEH84_00705 [Alphaproteobacteria bacterium]|nr:hypothetical protein [Alphaproteobacteria bacterium]
MSENTALRPIRDDTLKLLTAPQAVAALDAAEAELRFEAGFWLALMAGLAGATLMLAALLELRLSDGPAWIEAVTAVLGVSAAAAGLAGCIHLVRCAVAARRLRRERDDLLRLHRRYGRTLPE